MQSTDLDMNAWLHKPKTHIALIDATQANLMAVTLDKEANFKKEMELPHAWHWLYFHEAIKASDLAKDGHEKSGRFLPLTSLPYRMLAGGTLDFFDPINIGEYAQKTSTVESIKPKTGRTGALCFVTVEHSIETSGAMNIYERQNIVYRGNITAPAEKPMAPTTQADCEIVTQPGAIELFRYSALTFNAHKIHYDPSYCTDHDYENLVIHGPLIATQLLETFKKAYPSLKLKHFDYSGSAPLFTPSQLITRVQAESDNTATGWAQNEQGHLVQTAKFEW